MVLFLGSRNLCDRFKQEGLQQHKLLTKVVETCEFANARANSWERLLKRDTRIAAQALQDANVVLPFRMRLSVTRRAL